VAPSRRHSSAASALAALVLAAFCAVTGTALAATAHAGHSARAAGTPLAATTHTGHSSRGTGTALSTTTHAGHSARAAKTCANAGLMPDAHDLALVRAATLCLVNRERAARDERPLRANTRLQRAAQSHSDSMASGDYFEHVGPNGPGGGTPLARMRHAGYVSSHAGYEVGENIAWATLDLATPRAIVAAWMRSPGHRANILNAHYRETGIGVSPHPLASQAQGEPGAIYTQDFGVVSHR
jgi:uncharacterized protein YkwD